jgi:hypothetical protein
MEDKIEHIMGNFDFKKVRKVMKALNWKWAHSKKMARPKLPELRSMAYSLLRGAADDVSGPTSHQACGGFIANRDGSTLTLMFSVAEWDTFDFDLASEWESDEKDYDYSEDDTAYSYSEDDSGL